MKTFIIFIITTLLIICGLGSHTYVEAHSLFMKVFNSTYGTERTRLDSCGVCHYDSRGGGARNPYGDAYADNGYDFSSIQGLDPDDDGFLASEEILLLTMPGLNCENIVFISNSEYHVIDYADPSNPGCNRRPLDNDNDGYKRNIDCNDNNPAIYPGAVEDCYDGIDNDCDNIIDNADTDAINCPACTDADGDWYAFEGGFCGPADCDDNNPDINPGVIEDCLNRIDDDCDGLIDTVDQDSENCPVACTDSDNDGYALESGNCGPWDCDDSNPYINPAACDILRDGIDQDCNGKDRAKGPACVVG